MKIRSIFSEHRPPPICLANAILLTVKMLHIISFNGVLKGKENFPDRTTGLKDICKMPKYQILVVNLRKKTLYFSPNVSVNLQTSGTKTVDSYG